MSDRYGKAQESSAADKTGKTVYGGSEEGVTNGEQEYGITVQEKYGPQLYRGRAAGGSGRRLPA